jgi:hypothetical protein
MSTISFSSSLCGRTNTRTYTHARGLGTPVGMGNSSYHILQVRHIYVTTISHRYVTTVRHTYVTTLRHINVVIVRHIVVSTAVGMDG